MAIKSYANKAAYNAATKPTIESQVSLIETTREIIVDGVNVITTNPTVGDLVFLNESNEVTYIKGGSWIQKAIIPSAWVHVGYVYLRKGRQVGVIHKDGADEKWLDVSQFAWTDAVLDGAEHEKTIGLRFGIPDWNTTTSITFTYTATTLAEAAAACTAAIEAKLTELGAPDATIAEWWAYADEDNNRVIVQRDACTSRYFYNCTGLTHITWGDMPESNVYWHGERGYYTNNLGVMNIARTKAWATSGGRVPTAQEPVGPRAGNDAPVKPSEFETSEFCANLRAAYATYEEYLEKCYMVVYPQKYGCFALPSGKAMAEKYARMTAPTKAGGEKYKYPALYYGYNKSFGVGGLDFGDWHLPGVLEGCYLMADATLAALAPSISKMGTITITNGTHRWFAQRYHVNYAWLFHGTYGTLGYYIVTNTYRCQAVALLEID